MVNDDAREVMRFSELVEQMSATKPAGFWKSNTIKILGLKIVILLLSCFNT